MRRAGGPTPTQRGERCPRPSSHPCRLFRFSGTAQSHIHRAGDGACRTLNFCLCRLAGGCGEHTERRHSSRSSISLSSRRSCETCSSRAPVTEPQRQIISCKTTTSSSLWPICFVRTGGVMVKHHVGGLLQCAVVSGIGVVGRVSALQCRSIGERSDSRCAENRPSCKLNQRDYWLTSASKTIVETLVANAGWVAAHLDIILFPARCMTIRSNIPHVGVYLCVSTMYEPRIAPSRSA